MVIKTKIILYKSSVLRRITQIARLYSFMMIMKECNYNVAGIASALLAIIEHMFLVECK